MSKFLFITAIIVGFTVLGSFATTSIPAVQAVSSNDWRVTISGLVVNPMDLSLTDLAAMPQTNVEATIYCVDFPTSPVTSGKWTGVKLSTLFEQAGVSSSAVKVAFYASDGYATDLDLGTANHDDIILAYQKDGLPLTETLRLVVPGKWGYKWINQVTSIVLVDYDFKGKWESLGYSDTGDIQLSGSSSSPAREPIFTYPAANQTSGVTVPSTSSPVSNSSTPLPPQETQDTRLGPEPETTASLPIGWISFGIVAIVVVVCLLVYVKKRQVNRSPAQPAVTGEIFS